ncbi:hypothetical protein F5B21DRAFT_528855 [Xylaria acuta]|nr:hypothetical protein F5B21DRAFT_528855 [Xylaria acuta]
MAAQPGRTDFPCSNANEGRAACGFDPADGVRDRKTLNSCTICDSEAKMRCPACGTWYCERKCFKTDWDLHKALCKTLKNEFDAEKAPVNHVRAILFPMDANKPTWVWINLKNFDTSVIRALGITTRKPLQKAVNQLAAKDINKSLQHRKIGHGIRQFTVPKARFERPEGHNINKSIFALADPGSLRTYFGSAIFFGFRTYYQDNSVTKIYYEDAAPRDLRMIIEWYHTRPENPFISTKHRLPIKSYVSPGEEAFFWPAVKLNCTVDVDRLSQLSGKEVFPGEVVKVLSKDVLNNRTTCDLADMAGLPWVVQPCYTTFDPIADRGKEIELLYNERGAIYAPQTKNRFQRWRLDNSEGWVLPSHLPSKYCGSVLVVHKNACNIVNAHVKCFYDFVKARLDDVKPLAVYKTEEEGISRVLADEHELKKVITREAFEPWWQGCVNYLAKGMAFLYLSPYNDTNEAEYDPKEELKEALKTFERGVHRATTESIK